MSNLRKVYRTIEDWVLALPRGTYAILGGVIAGLSVLVVSTAIGDPDYLFPILMALTLSGFYYWFNPNRTPE